MAWRANGFATYTEDPVARARTRAVKLHTNRTAKMHFGEHRRDCHMTQSLKSSVAKQVLSHEFNKDHVRRARSYLNRGGI